jgi:hypothetical protein
VDRQLTKLRGRGFYRTQYEWIPARLFLQQFRQELLPLDLPLQVQALEREGLKIQTRTKAGEANAGAPTATAESPKIIASQAPSKLQPKAKAKSKPEKSRQKSRIVPVDAEEEEEEEEEERKEEDLETTIVTDSFRFDTTTSSSPGESERAGSRGTKAREEGEEVPLHTRAISRENRVVHAHAGYQHAVHGVESLYRSRGHHTCIPGTVCAYLKRWGVGWVGGARRFVC